MALKPQRVDDLIRPEHCFIKPDDVCFYFRERTSGERYDYSETNQLLANLKIPVENKGKPRWRYKTRAIKQIASELGPRSRFKNITLVPVPPSKIPSDPEYDDRLLQILRSVPVQDIREIVYLRYNLRPSHTGVRSSIEQLLEAYEVDLSLLDPVPNCIIIFDDMLTTGRHFKAMQQILQPLFPDVKIIGLFIARAIRQDYFDSIEWP